MNKKFFKSTLSTLLALLMVISCFAIPSSAAITLSKSSITITKGYASTLKVSGTSSKVTWSTGDKSIATVSSAGKVSGKGVGSTYIYAQVNDTTLKCQVTVVAGKITAGVNELEMTAGKSKIVNITCKGTHTISLSNSNKAVAYGTWNGAKFDGDVVPLTIKAVSSGTARIKVYAKNYPTVYAYIDVTVNGGAVNIVAQQNTVDVEVNKTATVKVYSSTKDTLSVQSNNTNIATATISSPSYSGNNYYSTVTIKGIKAGTATVRVSSTTSSSSYTDITINVTGAASEYYTISANPPTLSVPTDIILKFTYNYKTYYMLVPKDYDTAYTNSLIATYTGAYEYYNVYSTYPSLKAATDIVNSFFTTNGIRYILVPKDYDQAKYNTAIAQYSKNFEYYTVYNTSPTKKVATDIIETWYITDANGAVVTRYMLYPFNYDKDRVTNIINQDKGTNSTYALYTVLNSPPTSVADDEMVISVYIYGSTNKYMVVKKTMTMSEIAKKNKAIATASARTFYYTWYSELPEIDAATENYLTVMYNNVNYYLVYPKIDKNTTTFDAKCASADRGDQVTDVRPKV